ncbi:MAG: type II secretion system protein GspM [Candidatus Binataceae bacterium]|jgi:hypothetical protein
MFDGLGEMLQRIGDAIAGLVRRIGTSPIVQAALAAGGRLFRPLANALAPAYGAGQTWYLKREPRERTLLKIAAAIGGVLILYSFIYQPFIGLRADMQDRVEARQRELIQVRGLMRSYDRMQAALATAEKQTVPDKDFSLFSVMEQTLDHSVGRTKIGSITPSERPLAGGFQQHVVDLKLTGVSLAQIVDTLYGVQSLPVPVTVSNLHIKQQSQDSYSYDVDMTCMALGRSG